MRRDIESSKHVWEIMENSLRLESMCVYGWVAGWLAFRYKGGTSPRRSYMPHQEV